MNKDRNGMSQAYENNNNMNTIKLWDISTVTSNQRRNGGKDTKRKDIGGLRRRVIVPGYVFGNCSIVAGAGVALDILRVSLHVLVVVLVAHVILLVLSVAVYVSLQNTSFIVFPEEIQAVILLLTFLFWVIVDVIVIVASVM